MLNKGKPSREHTYPAIRAALLSLLHAWGSPFTLADVPQGCRIQATACDITGAAAALLCSWNGGRLGSQWHRAGSRCSALASFQAPPRCTQPLPPPCRLAAHARGGPRAGGLQRARWRRRGGRPPPGQGAVLPGGRAGRGGCWALGAGCWVPFSHQPPPRRLLNPPPPPPSPAPPLPQARCAEAFAAVRSFESRYCVGDAALPPSFVAARADWFSTAATFAAAFRLKDESLHDGVLLLDRAVAAGGEQLLGVNAAALIVGCLLIASRQGGLPRGRGGGGLAGVGLVGRRGRCLGVGVLRPRGVLLAPALKAAALLSAPLTLPAPPLPRAPPAPQPARPRSACRSRRSWRPPPACLARRWRAPRPPWVRCCRETPLPSLVSPGWLFSCRCLAAKTAWVCAAPSLLSSQPQLP